MNNKKQALKNDSGPDFSFIVKCLNKEEAQKEKKQLHLINKTSKLSRAKNKNGLLWSLSIQNLLDFFRDKLFSKNQMRKALKRHLFSFENVGFSNRNELWYQASDASLEQALNENNYYLTLRDKVTEIPLVFSQSIEMDLHRTASPNENNEENSLEYNLNVSKCENILKTYCKRNPDLGYCQGLNFIVWELLKRYEREEECFWILVVILENYLPPDYYTTMKGVLTDQAIFSIVLENLLPEINEKFKKCNVDCSMFSIQWFVCIFCKNLNKNKEILDIVFDNFFIQGRVALFKIGIVALKLMKTKIMKCKDFPQLLNILEEESLKINDGIRFQEMINEIYINKTLLQFVQNQLSSEEKHKALFLGEIEQKKLKESQLLCSTEFHHCLTSITINCSIKNYNRTADFYIFKQDPRLFITKKSYFKSKNTYKTSVNANKNPQKETVLKMVSHNDLTLKKDSLLLARQNHMCKLDLKLYFGLNSSNDFLSQKTINNLPFVNEKFVNNNQKQITMIHLKKNSNNGNKTPSTQTPKNDRKPEEIETVFHIKEEEDECELKNSMIFFKEKGIFKNIDDETVEKYIDELKRSPSIYFNKSLMKFPFE